MPEKPEILLEETSELLDELVPIVQRSISALEHDSNPLLQHLIQQEIELQEGLLQQVEEMKERIHNHLNPPEPVPQQDEPENRLRVEILRKGKRKGNFAWRVTMPNGEQIHCRFIIDTIIEVIKKLGVERIESLGIKCGLERRNYGSIRDPKGRIKLLKKICNALRITPEIVNHTR